MSDTRRLLLGWGGGNETLNFTFPVYFEFEEIGNRKISMTLYEDYSLRYPDELSESLYNALWTYFVGVEYLDENIFVYQSELEDLGIEIYVSNVKVTALCFSVTYNIYFECDIPCAAGYDETVLGCVITGEYNVHTGPYSLYTTNGSPFYTEYENPFYGI